MEDKGTFKFVVLSRNDKRSASCCHFDGCELPRIDSAVAVENLTDPDGIT